MRQKSYWLSLLALVLILCACIQPAWAYFTSNTEAAGSVKLYTKSEVEITEEAKGLVKTVTIANTEGSPVWVRAIAYIGSDFGLTVSGWGSTVGGNTWVYYSDPLYAGGDPASALTVKVTDIPASAENMTSFNVGVQFESIPVEYDTNGDPIPHVSADWESKLDGVTIER